MSIERNEWLANRRHHDARPARSKKQIFENMEFIRDINADCLNPNGDQIVWEENQGARIKPYLIHLDFNNLEK